MLLLKAAGKPVKRMVFSPDSRGFVAAGTRQVLYWPMLDDPAKPARFPASYIWGVDFLASGSHLIISKGDDGLWSHPIGGGEGRRFAPVHRILKFACSPVEPLVVVYEAMIYGSR